MATTDIQLQGSSSHLGGFDRSRLRAFLPIAVFDTAGPLAVYWLLRAAGTAEVTALILSGVLPAFGVIMGVIRHRRLDAIGALALLGIVVGTVAGLVSHSARLVLMEGSVPTAVFGLACLGSLLTSRPMLYRIALQTRGADTAAGRLLEARWAQPAARHAFRIITVVWGVTFLAEAATRVLIVETISAGTALLVVKLMPYIVIAGLMRWMAGYTRGLRMEPVPQDPGQRAVVLQAAATTLTDPAPVLVRR
jgi:intracellular septation protein A